MAAAYTPPHNYGQFLTLFFEDESAHMETQFTELSALGLALIRGPSPVANWQFAYICSGVSARAVSIQM